MLRVPLKNDLIKMLYPRVELGEDDIHIQVGEKQEHLDLRSTILFRLYIST